MKKQQRLLRQVEQTKIRTKDSIGKEAETKLLSDLSNEKNNKALDAFNQGMTEVFDNIVVNKEIEKRLTEKPFEKNVSVKQLNRYIIQQDIDVSRFFNDRSFRERIIKGDDTLDSNYLVKGTIAAKSVCRITIVNEDGEEEGYGTGFLVAPNILLTNNHVLPQPESCKLSYVEFNFEKDDSDLPVPTKIFKFDKNALFYTNEDLDYTIVHLESTSTDGASNLNEYKFLKLNPQLGKTKEGNYVSIIQHPDGKLKKVVLRENQVTNVSLPKFIRYVTDTKGGSSGSPVFNDKWEVVALHHSGIPKYNSENKIMNLQGGVWDPSQGESQIYWLENEGVRISSIVYDITTNAAEKFPFLLQFFTPITDIESIHRSMGISLTDLEATVYYSEVKDSKDKEVYYSSIDIETIDFDAIHELISSTKTNAYNYSPSKYVYPKVDLHPDGLIHSIYSGKKFSAQELILADEKVDIERKIQLFEFSKNESFFNEVQLKEKIDTLEAALPYNCEHVVCQSWFGKAEPMRGDLHHLFACESRCNSFRNNHVYFDFPDYEPEQDLLEKEMPKCGNMENGRFEPEQNKGIVARAVLYFLVMYPGEINVYSDDDITTLKEWSNNQKVGLYEKHRNREIFLLQGNRNPFIDYPELVDQIDFS